MKYIPLEELEKIIANIEKFYADNHWVIRVLKRDIEFIETIDPIATIDDMIEEIITKKKMYDKPNGRTEKLSYEINFLQEIKSRLSLTE